MIECAYDSMGRRATKKMTINKSVTLNQRYLYRGILQHQSVFEQARKFIFDTDSEKAVSNDGNEYLYYGILKVYED